MNKRLLAFVFLLFFSLLIVACGGAAPAEEAEAPAAEVEAPEAEEPVEEAPAEEMEEPEEEMADMPKVALIIAQGGLGDRSYNDLANSGLERAAADMGVEVQAIESADPVGEAEQLLRTAAEAGFDLVLTLEYSHFDPLARVAPDYPDTTFGIVNIEVDQPNVVSVIFKEHEGSFLAGALASMVTSMEGNEQVNEDKVIGVIGGVQSAGIDKFLVGYEEGAQYVDPDVEVIKAYSESFGDPAKGQELTLAMFEQGADIVYQVAGGTGEGVFTAAEEEEHYAIGVDADQDFIKPGFILTSMIKRVDNAVYDVVGKVLAGEELGGRTLEYGLVEDGVGLSPMEYTKEDVPQEFLDEVAAIQEKIINGEIVVTDVTQVDAPAEEEAAAEPAELPKVALIIAQGGLGDRSYNDLANSGLERAAADLGVDVQAIESADPVGEAEQLLRTAAEAGFDLVLTLEYSHFDPLARVAPDYPDTTFGIVNIEVEGDNVVSVLFKEHEGSFLAGALASMVTSMDGNDKVNEDKVIGVIGGVQSAGIDKFLVGYEEGAQFIDPDVEVIKAYSESFGDPAKGQELTLAMYEQGADIVYQVAGGTGEGVFTAAEEEEHYAIGVDADQDYIKPGYILTSMVKRVDNAVYDVVAKMAAGEELGGRTVEYGLVEEGVGLSPMEYTIDDIPQEFLDKIAELHEMIINGEITVTDVTQAE